MSDVAFDRISLCGFTFISARLAIIDPLKWGSEPLQGESFLYPSLTL